MPQAQPEQRQWETSCKTELLSLPRAADDRMNSCREEVSSLLEAEHSLRDPAAVTQTRLKHANYLPCCGQREKLKSCGPSGNPELETP